jgi:DNA-binding NarL/FixJ family response regulator
MIGPIRILAVDDHALLRKGIAAILASQPDIILVAEASNGREAVDQYRTHRPDITLMDLQMPAMNGLDAMVTILAEFPDARIIVLTTYVGDIQILRALKGGARGYLLKTTLDRELLETIRAVHSGRKMISAEASYDIAEHAASDALTPAELDVLRLIASGHANKQIAARLSITEDSVKGRVKNILSKLGATDRTHAAMIAVKRGFIQS